MFGYLFCFLPSTSFVLTGDAWVSGGGGPCTGTTKCDQHTSAMQAVAGPSSVVNLSPPLETVNLYVEPILADVSDALWTRAGKARKAPTSEITFNNVPPEFASVFCNWSLDKAGLDKLWRPVQRSSRSKGEPEFWSFRPEAAHALCRFEEMTAEENLPANNDLPGGTFVTATGNLRLTERGDIAVILPHLHVRLRTVLTGKKKIRKKHVMSLKFTVGVVSASRRAQLKLHPKYPKYGDARAWFQVPWFEDPGLHFARYVQKLCKDCNILDRRAHGVQAALSWEFVDPEPVTALTINRPEDLRAINGLMWMEEHEKYVPAQTKHMRDFVGRANFSYREHRLQQTRRTIQESAHVDDESSEDEEVEEPDVSDLQWFLSQPSCPQWVYEERDALILSGRWPESAQVRE